MLFRSAAFGSVSAVTFITASNYFPSLEIIENIKNLNLPGNIASNPKAFIPGGEMVAAMALMESPSIIIGVWLYRKFSDTQDGHHMDFKEIMKEAFLNGSIVVLLGSLLIGIVSNEHGSKIMSPFIGDIFKGMLSFFLLDMGLMAAKNFGGLKGKPLITLCYAIGAPLIHALLALFLCRLLALTVGDTILMMVLAASASYIAVPAVLRHALPEVNPALYMGMSLGITFPFNIILGIHLYTYLAQALY